MAGGGFPYAIFHDEMRALGVAVPVPPSPGASRIEAMQELWTAILGGGGVSVGPKLAAMTSGVSRASQRADAGAPAD